MGTLERSSPVLRKRPRRTVGAPADDAVHELVRDHADAIYRVAMSVVNDRHLAEDVVQETILKAWQALPQWRGDGSKRSWVLSIAHNTAVSTLRRTRDTAREPSQFADAPARDDVERSTEALSDLSRLKTALAELDDLSRSIVVMRDLEAMTYQQISEVLGVPLPTIKTRLLRARRELQRAMTIGVPS